MKKIGVTGYKGKLGSILVGRPNFVPIDCDITNRESIEKYIYIEELGGKEPLDVIVNCAAISDINECETYYDRAIEVNVHGLANLHKIFGSRVLNISSDHVFPGKSWFPPSEDKKPYPISAYGHTKLGAEAVSQMYMGKTIRLSRTVSLSDLDIRDYLVRIVGGGFQIDVPTFFHRNYTHREFAVDGIEYMANNWDSIKFGTVHYATTENFSMYLFMYALADAMGLDANLVKPRNEYLFDAPRPKRGGLRVSLAKKLGFPMHTMAETIQKLVQDG